jgi:uncharacterized membrane protein YhaH (DUF805 family)
VERIGRYFSFQGRTARLPFWQVQLLLSVIFTVLIFAVVGVTIAGFPAQGGVGIVLLMVLFAPYAVLSLANGVRRLHDRNKSGLWLLLFWIAPSLLAEAARPFENDANLVLLVLALGLASLGISLWGLIEIGFRKGTVGPNRFGDDPMAPAAEVFA